MPSGRAGTACTRRARRPRRRPLRWRGRSVACRCSTTGRSRRTRSPHRPSAASSWAQRYVRRSFRIVAAVFAPADVQATFCTALVRRWTELGLRHAVVAPGSRSTPMALALAESGVRVEIVHDERSAAFVALGIGLASGVPAVALCTSGTAATHFHAAVVEAGLSNVPMLVLTADRPPELHGVGAAQTIDQTKLFGGAPRWFHDPGVADVGASPTWAALADQAWSAAASGTDQGPVHLNLPMREPLVGRVIEDLGATVPAVPGGARLRLPADVESIASTVTGRRGLIVAGRGVGDSTAVDAL